MSISKLFGFYQRINKQRPILTQAVQVGVLMGAGDLISQTLIERKTLSNIDRMRTIKFAAIGCFMVGPTLRVWYGVLNHYIGSSGKSVTFKKVVLDQTLFAPSFIICILTVVGFTQGKDWLHVKKDMENNYLDVLKTNYLIWPWVLLGNFYYVPLHYQVLVVQIVALFWNTYLSWKTNNDLNNQLLE